MCIQPRFKSVCASTQSDQSLSFLSDEMMDPWLPIEDSDQSVHMHRLIGVSIGAHANLYLLLDAGSYGHCHEKTCLWGDLGAACSVTEKS